MKEWCCNLCGKIENLTHFQIGKEVDSKWFKVFDSVDTLDYFTRSKQIETQEEIDYLTKKYL